MHTLKAYVVRERHEGHCAIAFATNGAEGRRRGGLKLDLSFEEVESCTRAPQFDKYALAGHVPRSELLKDGWWFECSHCGDRVTQASMDPDTGEECEPALYRDLVFCCSAHRVQHWAEMTRREAEERAAVEAAHLVFHGLPVSVLAVKRFYKAGGIETELTVEIGFPGMKGPPARWVPGEPTLSVCQLDLDAWNALKGPAA